MVFRRAMATHTTRMPRHRLPTPSQARLLVRTRPRAQIMARVRPRDLCMAGLPCIARVRLRDRCMAGLPCLALQRLKHPQQPVLAAAIRYLRHCLELEIMVVLANESEFPVHTWTIAKPFAK